MTGQDQETRRKRLAVRREVERVLEQRVEMARRIAALGDDFEEACKTYRALAGQTSHLLREYDLPFDSFPVGVPTVTDRSPATLMPLRVRIAEDEERNLARLKREWPDIGEPTT